MAGQGVTPGSFAAAVLRALKAPLTSRNLQVMTAWETAEGGNWHNTATYNPLNTTLNEPGATSINDVGVKAYTSWAQGLAATVATLEEPAYRAIVQDLRGSADPNTTAAAIVASPWGTQSISIGTGTVSAGGDNPGSLIGPAGVQTAGFFPNPVGGLTDAIKTATIVGPLVIAGGALAVWGLARATGAGEKAKRGAETGAGLAAKGAMFA